MDTHKVYFAIRYNTGLRLRAIDSLHFARQCKARDYSSPRIAESIQTQAGKFFASKPTEYKAASDWNPTFKSESGRLVRFLEDCQSGSSLRFVGFADTIDGSGIDNQGWYCDNFQDEVFRAAIWQLPGRDGEAYYLAGYIEPWNDGGLIDVGSHYAASGDNCLEAMQAAARDADHMAMRFAEDSREADTKFQAEQRIESAREEIAEAREDHSATIAELRSITAQCDLFGNNAEPLSLRTIESNPRICDAIRSQLSGYRETVSELVREIKRLNDEPWTINEGC